MDGSAGWCVMIAGQNAYYAEDEATALAMYERAAPMADDGEAALNLAKLHAEAGNKAKSKAAAELALSKGREDLAKAALGERQKAADMAGGLVAEIAVVEDTLKTYEIDIAKLQGKLREARARQNSISTRIDSPSGLTSVTLPTRTPRTRTSLPS